MAKLPWTPWHEVVKLREDLRSGELPMHMFAADLYEVLMQNGKFPIYENPEHFFALTYPTYNLRQLVRDVVLRVAGKNDKAVRQLQLTYGGGKTHTLITLRHMVADPENLPDMTAVKEFIGEIGQQPPKARVAGLCFDKLDPEKGMEVRSPDGKPRTLKHPWSVLAWQIAGAEGLKLLHAENKDAERESPPAENLLTALLEIPVKEGLGVLVLIDEVLMFVRSKVALDPSWDDRMINFFQYLTQAAAKVDRCCIVASLLASETHKSDELGQRLQDRMYSIFQRQREEVVEPVVKEDVAEVLRRRFFTPESLKDADAFRPHVQAALKGITALDEQTARLGSEAEDRYKRSFPFHPDLTEVFYTKWTALSQFQKARGVLRTFALALREAEKWDQSPLIGSAAFLNAQNKEGLSDALRELVTVADSDGQEGGRQAWTGILEGELGRARDIQRDSMGLNFREVEQAVVTVFLHSQPTGRHAMTRELMTLLGATRPDKINLEKGLKQWAQNSYWLDDRYTAADANQLPDTWRLGNRPNLVQMHATEAARISKEMVRARLIEEIQRTKSLVSGASSSGVRVHTLPAFPRDIEDDGEFHYAILGPDGASDSGKPSAEARRYLDETTSVDKPRVFRNALILLTPSRDGLEAALLRVRDYLAWEQVGTNLRDQERSGNVDVARMQTFSINLDKAKSRIQESIRQAYCIVVTVSEKNDAQAFKINVTEEPHFNVIKADTRSRIQESSITAETLLPDGPYDLWHMGETSRRVKDLSGAFAQLPHLPKMLKADAILDTLIEGCLQGSFVLRLPRPDRTFRAWWRSRPDVAALKDPALELVLTEAAELSEIPPALLTPGTLPELWTGESITVQMVQDYFDGKRSVKVPRDGFTESIRVPKADEKVLQGAVGAAVESGNLWLLNGPASVLAEPVPMGTLTPAATLRRPPAMLSAVEVMPESLPEAWKDGAATALSIATALSQKHGNTLPWKTVRDVVGTALTARFIALDPVSGSWPCDFPAAHTIALTVGTGGAGGHGAGTGLPAGSKYRVARTEMEPSEIQDLGDIIPKLLEVKAKANVPLKFHVQIELGDGKTEPPAEVIQEVNRLLKNLRDGFQVE